MEAGRLLANALQAVDPLGTNDVILVLNEMRDRTSAERLVRSVGRKGLRVAAMTEYRFRDGADEQQDAVVTTLPVVKSRWARWRYDPVANPPRGYAFASVVVEPAVTAHVYAVHLKANGGGKDAAQAMTNALKRAGAIAQVLRIEQGPAPVILAGDFNADCWSGRFSNETVFAALDSAGFRNPLALLPPDRRRTHVSGCALDYILTRGFETAQPPVVVPVPSLSDHHAVFVLTRNPS